MAGFDLLTC